MATYEPSCRYQTCATGNVPAHIGQVMQCNAVYDTLRHMPHKINVSSNTPCHEQGDVNINLLTHHKTQTRAQKLTQLGALSITPIPEIVLDEGSDRDVEK